jgi:hypothetical protein
VVRTVHLEGYDFFVPAQLRMSKVKSTVALSLIFSKCRIQSSVFNVLIDELMSFEGEYQRFTFQNLQMTRETCESLFGALENGRPFRTLESIELDYLELKQPIHDLIPLIVKGIGRALGHIRFLQKLSFARWSIPVWIPLQLFLK